MTRTIRRADFERDYVTLAPLRAVSVSFDHEWHQQPQQSDAPLLLMLGALSACTIIGAIWAVAHVVELAQRLVSGGF